MKYEAKGNYKRTSPVAHRYQILEDEETGWGRNIRQLMGVYRKQHDGTFCLDDIRRTDLTRLTKYPKTTFRVGPLPLQHPIEGLDEGQFCLFNWKFTFKVKTNPCEIEVDESKPIIFVSQRDFTLAAMKACQRNTDSLPKSNARRQTDVCVLIYDLLHEADRYVGRPVDVQFSLTDKYISFQHTGRHLTAENILNLCGLGYASNDVPRDDIAYHCGGLREFLLSNDHTIIVSNGFTVRFDNVGGRLNVAWLERKDMPRELKISLARNKRFTESIIMPFSKERSGEPNNYKVGLHCVFEDVQNIAFCSNIGKVAIKIKGGKTKTLDRKGWVVSKEYEAFVPKEIRQKTIDKKSTSIIFACRYKSKTLIGEDDAPIYSLLPTTSSFGFPFLMNLDIHINKTNFAISRKDSWNKAYAEIAGRLFAKWITDLTVKGEFTPRSIYNMVPKFDDCIARHPEERLFITQFQKGFKAIILNDKKEQKPAEPAPSKTTKEKGNLYVIDTNVFVNCPDILSKMNPNDVVVLSAKVVDELDNLKYKMEDKDLRNVQKALKNINEAIDKPNVRMEMSDVSLLPRDFDRHNPDNNILSVVIRHKAQSPTLLTSDNGLQIKAKGIGISVIGLKEFLAKRRKALK